MVATTLSFGLTLAKPSINTDCMNRSFKVLDWSSDRVACSWFVKFRSKEWSCGIGRHFLLSSRFVVVFHSCIENNFESHFLGIILTSRILGGRRRHIPIRILYLTPNYS